MILAAAAVLCSTSVFAQTEKPAMVGDKPLVQVKPKGTKAAAAKPQPVAAKLQACLEHEDGTITLFAPPTDFYKAKTVLLEAFPGTELEIQEIRFLPQASKSLGGEDLELFEKLLAMLNDCDDVQDIYHNVNIPS